MFKILISLAIVLNIALANTTPLLDSIDKRLVYTDDVKIFNTRTFEYDYHNATNHLNGSRLGYGTTTYSIDEVLRKRLPKEYKINTFYLNSLLFVDENSTTDSSVLYSYITGNLTDDKMKELLVKSCITTEHCPNRSGRDKLSDNYLTLVRSLNRHHGIIIDDPVQYLINNYIPLDKLLSLATYPALVVDITVPYDNIKGIINEVLGEYDKISSDSQLIERIINKYNIDNNYSTRVSRLLTRLNIDLDMFHDEMSKMLNSITANKCKPIIDIQGDIHIVLIYTHTEVLYEYLYSDTIYSPYPLDNIIDIISKDNNPVVFNDKIYISSNNKNYFYKESNWLIQPGDGYSWLLPFLLQDGKVAIFDSGRKVFCSDYNFNINKLDINVISKFYEY